MKKSFSIVFGIIFLSVFSIIILSNSVIADYCIVNSGGSYSCFSKDSYDSNAGNFQDYCENKLFGTYSTNDNDPKCLQGCCCSKNTANALNYDEETNNQECIDRGDLYGFVVGEDSCVSYCANDYDPAVTGVDTYNVSGRVTMVTDQETQEPLDSVQIYFPSRGSFLSTTSSNADGDFELLNVPSGSKILFKKKGCINYEETLELTSNKDDWQVSMDCSASGCLPEKPTSISVNSIQGEPTVVVSWQHSLDCNNFQKYIVYRCNSEDICEEVGYSQSATTFRDENVPYDQKFCYKVGVEADSEGISTIIMSDDDPEENNCIVPINRYCVENFVTDTNTFCLNDEQINNYVNLIEGSSDVLGLDSGVITGKAKCVNNALYFLESCDGQVCVNNECQIAGMCDLCNGLFGAFVSSAYKVSTANPNIECSELLGCYLDNNGLSYDNYDTCANIKSCYDYNSESACGNNDCGLQFDCVWQPSDDSGVGELGLGACAPLNTEVTQECERCNDLAICNSEICSYFGSDCSYISGFGCLNKENTRCEFYDNQEDCEGSQSVMVDTSLSNEITPSDDLAGLGLCKWDSNSENCIKDANNYIEFNSLEVPKTDCAESGLASNEDCLYDYEAPTTIPGFFDGSYITEEQLNELPLVKDNVFGSEDIETFACLEPLETEDQVATCYPSDYWTNVNADIQGLARYALRYFSKDPAGNLEPVKELKVYIYSVSDAHLIAARAQQ